MAVSVPVGVGNLGTLFIRLQADPSNLIQNMNLAVARVRSGNVSMIESLSTLSGAFKAMGLAAGAAFAIVSGMGLKTYAQFNEEMTKATSIMGKMNEGMRKQLEDTARSIASDGLLPAAKLAQGYYTLTSAGLSAEQALKALPIVSKFASAGQMELAKATELLAGAQSALGLAMKDPVQNMENMKRLGDLLVKSNIISLGTTQDFAEALERAAGSMKNYGVNTEEGIAVLAAFAQQNQRGFEAGTQFSIVLRDLQRAAIENDNQFRRLGITVFDANMHLLPLADILGSMEKAFEGMSSGEKKANFELLGFQDRSLRAMLALIGTSQSVRDYTKLLQEAGGVTEEVADKRMTSFISQITVTWHRIQDLFITIGEAIAGPLKEYNEILQVLTARHGTFSNVVQFLATTISQFLVNHVRTLIMLFGMWLEAMKIVGNGVLILAEVALKGFELMVKGIEAYINGVVNGIIGGVNLAIKAVNLMIEAMPEWLKDQVGVSKVHEIAFRLNLDWQSSKVKEWEQALEGTRTKLNGLDTDLLKTGKAAETTADKTISSFHRMKKEVESDVSAMEASSIRMKKALDRMGAPELPIDFTTGLPRRDAQGRFMGMSKAEMGIAVQGQSGDPTVLKALQNQKEMEEAKHRLGDLKKLSDQEVALNAETQKRKMQAIELYNRQVKQLHMQQAQLVLATSSTMFGDLSTIAEAFAGKQSGIYKAMFAASKAFAIAEATVKILQGVASAASLPWPANLAAMASVIAATASIVTNIQAVKLEFAGARARGGPTEAGKAFLVGEEGPEMFVPSVNGSIVPNNHLGGGGTRIIVNNYTDVRPEVNERQDGNEKIIEVLLRRNKNEIASEIREGRGIITKAIESTFTLRRGRGQ